MTIIFQLMQSLYRHQIRANDDVIFILFVLIKCNEIKIAPKQIMIDVSLKKKDGRIDLNFTSA